MILICRAFRCVANCGQPNEIVPEDDAINKASAHALDDDGANSEVSTDVGNDSPRPPDCRTINHGLLAGLAPYENLTIFDWDDTLFPTTWLREQGLLRKRAVITPEHHAQLDALAQFVAITLEMAKRRGGVAIVTNAEQGWVEMSCEEIMPSLQAHLAGVRIISASSRHEKHWGFAPRRWKCLAFEELVNEFYGTLDRSDVASRRNVISMGDSEHEMEALRRVAASTECRAKCLKFCPKPSLEQLMRQHEELARFVDDVVGHDGNLDCKIGGEGDRGSTPPLAAAPRRSPP